MWLPSKSQWAVLWIGLIAISAAIGDMASVDSPDWAVVLFAAGATTLIIWMIESRRGKP